MRVASKAALLAVVTMLGARAARADQDVDHTRAVIVLQDDMSRYATFVAHLQGKGDHPVNKTDTQYPASKCDAAVAASKPTVKDGDVLTGAFEDWPGAVQSGSRWTIKASEAPRICATYAKLRAAALKKS